MAHDLYFQENTIEQLLEVIATNEFPIFYIELMRLTKKRGYV